jgi:hypothetical protein
MTRIVIELLDISNERSFLDWVWCPEYDVARTL